MANILIVDDDPAVQIAIRLMLEQAGHQVTVAGDGRKGPALFETGPFDLLFLDIFMPGMDGLETMRHVRARAPSIPIIVISGRAITPDAYAEPDFLKMATKLGAIAANTVARAIARGVHSATPLPFPGALPSWRDRFG